MHIRYPNQGMNPDLLEGMNVFVHMLHSGTASSVPKS